MIIKKIYNLKFVIRNCQKGMTYVELIVVLSIFSVLSAVTIFNYKVFQAKVDIKNLGSDIALKVVEAQKSSLSGVLPVAGGYGADWKPSYGVYFDITKPQQFIYFSDLNNQNGYEVGNGETLDTIIITKNNFISNIDSYLGAVVTPITSPLATMFKRPDSSTIFKLGGLPFSGFDYIQITIKSPSGPTALIKIYPSGRVQMN